MEINLENSIQKIDEIENKIVDIDKVVINIIIRDFNSNSIYCNTNIGRIIIKENVTDLEMCSEEEIINAVLNYVENKEEI